MTFTRAKPGGWQTGDKTSVQIKPRVFNERGFVFVSTNYRLLPHVEMDVLIRDVAKSLGWVHKNIAEHGGDPNRIFVMGHSAGAQLAALVCTDDRFLKAEGVSPTIIKGCVPVDGDTYDVPMQIATVEERIADIYRRKFGDEASQKDLSPVTHVTEGKYIPPVLILHVAEHPETKAQSNRLVRVLQEAGYMAKAYPAQNKDHSSINADLGLPDDPPTRVLFEFITSALDDR
jgi:arylformamidase